MVEHLALYQLYQYIPIYKQRKQVFHWFRLDGYDTVNMKLTSANLIDKKTIHTGSNESKSCNLIMFLFVFLPSLFL